MKSLDAIVAPFLLIAFIIGCTNPNDETDKILKQLDKDLQKQQEDMAKMTNFLYLGGQPGSININGSVVKSEGDKTVLDDRIKTSQKVGNSLVKSDAVTLNIAETNKATLSLKVDDKSAAALEKLSSGTEYINIGCNQLDTNLVEGLSETKLTALTLDIATISAKTIVVCGKVNLPYLFVILSADNIVLIDTDYSYINTFGSITLKANNLTLIGENKISTRGIDSTSSVIPAPSINLTIAKSILGEGSLLVSSVGGDCVKEIIK